jgi:hypothetical protein
MWLKANLHLEISAELSITLWRENVRCGRMVAGQKETIIGVTAGEKATSNGDNNHY